MNRQCLSNMKKVLTILFLFLNLTSFSTEPKDTTKFKLRLIENKKSYLSDIIRKKKIFYHFDGRQVHLIFDSHYVDTVTIRVYHAVTLKNLSVNRYYIPKQENNVEMLINVLGIPLIIMVDSGEDIFIYQTQ